MERIKNYEDLLRVIRNAITVRGITQTELAAKVGITQPQLNRFLHNKHTPSVSLVFKLVDALGIHVGAVISGS